LCKERTQRPRGAQVVEALRESTSSFSEGILLRNEFLLSRKANFPQGIPEDLKEFIVEESELRETTRSARTTTTQASSSSTRPRPSPEWASGTQWWRSKRSWRLSTSSFAPTPLRLLMWTRRLRLHRRLRLQRRLRLHRRLRLCPRRRLQRRLHRRLRLWPRRRLRLRLLRSRLKRGGARRLKRSSGRSRERSRRILPRSKMRRKPLS